MKVKIPPIKSQGIKTKLIPWIKSIVPSEFDGDWIEPFMGTGVVGFNISPQRALLCDSNPYLIDFYSAILEKRITSGIVRNYLNKEGAKLLEIGDPHYYAVRERFNKDHHPLDFLFLNRAGFNGMIRFNRKGKFNIPFCRKPNRFAQAYITKIVNQVDFISKILEIKNYTFICQDFEKTVNMGASSDIIYCDPPYIERHTDYYNGWDEEQERKLFRLLSNTPAKFILSTWHHNDYRANDYIDSLWRKFNILTREHFYHVGANENNRKPMVEAIVTNFDLPTNQFDERQKPVQLELLSTLKNDT